ncbi:MAG: hypothetical protein HKN41_03230 [Ilumatobacter sp.]|nr:hypothetical protein [Ilumatobacter sp.]
MVKFVQTVQVQRPVDEVFASWADLERSPEWAAPVLERRKLTDGPVAVGTRFLARDRFPGREVEFELEITALETDQHMAAEWFEPMGGGWDATFVEAEGGCRVTLEASMEPTGVMKMLSPIVAPWARRQMRKDLDSFKQLLESGGGKESAT